VDGPTEYKGVYNHKTVVGACLGTERI